MPGGSLPCRGDEQPCAQAHTSVAVASRRQQRQGPCRHTSGGTPPPPPARHFVARPLPTTGEPSAGRRGASSMGDVPAGCGWPAGAERQRPPVRLPLPRTSNVLSPKKWISSKSSFTNRRQYVLSHPYGRSSGEECPWPPPGTIASTAAGAGRADGRTRPPGTGQGRLRMHGSLLRAEMPERHHHQRLKQPTGPPGGGGHRQAKALSRAFLPGQQRQ